MDTLPVPSTSVSLATAQLVEERLKAGEVRLSIRTSSMSPALQAGDKVLVRKASTGQLHIGDILVLRSGGTLVAHRLIAQRFVDGLLLLTVKGDNRADADSPCEPAAVAGLVVSVRRGEHEMDLQTHHRIAINWVLAMFSYGHWKAMQERRALIKKVATSALRAGLRTLAALFSMLLVLLVFLPGPAADAAVKVSSFTAKPQGNKIQVTWKTGTEVNNVGFNLLRSTSQNGTYSRVNSSIIPSQCLGCLNGADYTFTDGPVSPGSIYFYKLQSVETSGHTQDFGPVSVTIAGATVTPTAAASRTPTRGQTNTPGTTGAPSTATATRTAAASTVTATRALTPGVPTSTRMLTGISQSSVHASVTPQTKIAYAAKLPSPEPPRPADGRNSDPLPTEPAVPVAVDAQIEQGEANPEYISVEQPTSLESRNRALVTFAAFGLSGLFGCASLVSGFLAIVLLVRASRRY